MSQEASTGVATRPDHVPVEAVVDIDYHTFGGVADPEFNGDHQLAWKALQDSAGPDLRWTPRNGGHWIALRAEHIGQVLEQPTLFSSRILALPKEVGEVYRFIPLSLDPPEHGPYRALLTPLLSGRVVQGKQADIRALANELIDGFIDRGGCEAIADFANILPIAIFHQLVGFPAEERERLRRMAGASNAADPGAVAAMLEAIGEFVAPIIQQRRKSPGDDLISGLLAGTVNGQPVSDQDALHMCQQLFIGGFHTTAGTLGFVLLHLAREPQLRRALREAGSRMGAALHELTRRFSLVGIPRTATADTTLAGQRIVAGDAVYLPLILYNLDERSFTDPLRIDLERGNQPNATFGLGIHKCPGMLLAKTELSIALQTWLQRIPEFDVQAGASIRIKGGSVGGVESLPLTWP